MGGGRPVVELGGGGFIPDLLLQDLCRGIHLEEQAADLAPEQSGCSPHHGVLVTHVGEIITSIRQLLHDFFGPTCCQAGRIVECNLGANRWLVGFQECQELFVAQLDEVPFLDVGNGEREVDEGFRFRDWSDV